MKKLLLIIFLFISFFAYSSKKLILVYERGSVEAVESAKKIEAKFKQLYPNINIVIPILAPDIDKEILLTSETELIFYFIGHSDKIDEADAEIYGGLMMSLKSFNSLSELTSENIKEYIYLSGNLTKSLQLISGDKLVIIDGCYCESAYRSLKNTSWLFCSSKDQPGCSIRNEGLLFSDYLAKNLTYNISISELSETINKELYSNKLFITNKKYMWVKNKPTNESPTKSKYYGEYVF